MNYGELFKLTNIIGAMLMTLSILSYITMVPFIWMSNFQSLFTKKRQTSLGTSLFTKKTYYQELCLGRVAGLCVLQHGGENIKKLKNDSF